MNHEKSKQYFERACEIVPGGVHSPVRAFNHVGGTPVFFESGEGALLRDVDGNHYIDFCLSWGPLLLGHSPAPVVAAIREQAGRATSFGACHPREVLLCEKILEAFPFLEQIRLVSSGTEAVMTAIRIARGATGRNKILKFDGCYHGHSDGLLAKAGSGVAALTDASSHGVPAQVVGETLIASFQDLKTIEKILKTKSVALLVLEPIPANHGLWIPERNYLETVMGLAKAHGTLVLFDEVISGFRISATGASGYFDLKPDLVTLGKIIGGGLPLAAVLGKRETLSVLAPLGNVYQAGTLSGNPLATAAGIAVLEVIKKENPYTELAKNTERFAKSLEGLLKQRYEARVKQIASVFWIQLGADHSEFPYVISPKAAAQYRELFHRCLEAGIYLAPSPYEVGFLSTAHTPDIIDEALERMERCLQ